MLSSEFTGACERVGLTHTLCMSSCFSCRQLHSRRRLRVPEQDSVSGGAAGRQWLPTIHKSFTGPTEASRELTRLFNTWNYPCGGHLLSKRPSSRSAFTIIATVFNGEVAGTCLQCHESQSQQNAELTYCLKVKKRGRAPITNQFSISHFVPIGGSTTDTHPIKKK